VIEGTILLHQDDDVLSIQVRGPWRWLDRKCPFDGVWNDSGYAGRARQHCCDFEKISPGLGHASIFSQQWSWLVKEHRSLSESGHCQGFYPRPGKPEALAADFRLDRHASGTGQQGRCSLQSSVLAEGDLLSNRAVKLAATDLGCLTGM
jgi:hypothetical protein